jgi:hypothetical protein
MFNLKLQPEKRDMSMLPVWQMTRKIAMMRINVRVVESCPRGHNVRQFKPLAYRSDMDMGWVLP